MAEDTSTLSPNPIPSLSDAKDEVVLVTELTTVGATGSVSPGIYVVTRTSTLAPRPTGAEDEVDTGTTGDGASNTLGSGAGGTRSGQPTQGGGVVTSVITTVVVEQGETRTIETTTPLPLPTPTPSPLPDVLLTDSEESNTTSANTSNTADTSSRNLTNTNTGGGITVTAASHDLGFQSFTGPSGNETTKRTNATRLANDIQLQDAPTTQRGSNVTTTPRPSISTYHRLAPTTLTSDIPVESPHVTGSSSGGSDTLDDAGDGNHVTPTDTNGQPYTQTYVTNGLTLSGSEAASAIAAASADGDLGQTVASGGGGLSSYAIVGAFDFPTIPHDSVRLKFESPVRTELRIGIVAGCLVGLVIVWVGWYKWRNKRLRQAHGEELGDDDTHSTGYPRDHEKNDQEPHAVLSGFDFIDQPPITSSTQRDRNDPFGDHEAEYTAAYRLSHDNSAFAVGRGAARPESELEAIVEDLDVDELGNALQSAMPINQRRDRYATRQTSQLAEWDNPNPFNSPRIAYAGDRPASDLVHSHAPEGRPDTTMTAQSYGEIYDGYASSRPQTHLDPGDHLEAMRTAKTPATSTLLPWLDREATPNMPPERSLSTRLHSHHSPDPYAEGEYEDAYEMISDTPLPPPQAAAPKGKVRSPPRAAMAGTPGLQGAGGFQGVIPNFR